MSPRIFSATDILIPKTDDMAAWAVIACDQHTSEPEYWSEVERLVGNEPSALHLILPEAYLNDSNVEKKTSEINRCMEQYKEEGMFQEYNDCYCYVERELSNGKIRHGIVGVIDLEQYDCSPDSQSPVRPTEGTSPDRLPPRIKVREHASLELPHIMVLIDDADRQVVEPLEKAKDSLKLLYDFDLMQHGGHIKGWLVSEEWKAKIDKAFDRLCQKAAEDAKQGTAGLVIAMGDGNHSFATAKACWDRIKETIPREQWEGHPARYSLVELNNIYDESMEFEPIHRVVFGVNPEDFIHKLYERFDISEQGKGQVLEYIVNGQRKRIGILSPTSQLATGTVQTFIEEYIAQYSGTVDYIHGEDVVEKLCGEADTVGIIFPEISKERFFASIKMDGPMPKKTFSLGNADDKRFYLEARKIV
ncbi:MAG: DUF1015 domain-containing protein [Lachnospiraceae bacterium]